MRTLMLAALLVAGCSSAVDDGGLSYKLALDPEPPKVGKSKIVLDVADKEGKPVAGATLRLEGNMSHAGMKPVFADAKEEKPGTYRAELEFTMAGDWFILVEGTTAEGKKVRKKIDVKGVEK